MTLLKKFSTFAVLVSGFFASADPLSLASPFSDHAVLQRGVEAPVWGRAEPGSAVRVVVKEGAKTVFEASTSADSNGDWQVATRAFDAGGPYVLEVSTAGGETLAIEDVLFGDVWICSGQSNMEMTYGWGLTRGREDVENNTYPDIRLLNVPNKTSITPVGSFKAPWRVCEPEAAKHFSAVGYFFGAALKDALPDVPIGLIDVTWSGTYIQTWLSLESLETVASLQDAVAERREAIALWLREGVAGYEKRLAEWWSAVDPFSGAEMKPSDPAFDDSGWATVELPKKLEEHIDRDFDGLVWYRTEVMLTDAQAKSNATLSLGAIDDEDASFVNGVHVGGTVRYNTRRRYAIPSGTLRAGVNVIAVRVLDTAWAGGFVGTPEQLVLDLEDDSVPLARTWRYHAKPLSADKKPKSLDSPSANSFSACYNGMFKPLFPLAAKGAIWYQGCSNVGHEELYARVFPAMVADWRANLTTEDFPVYLVQLAAYKQTNEKPFDSAWARMRWTMTRLGETVPHSGTAVAIDVGDHHDIHPKDKKTVGERLARLALHRTYGRSDVVEAGPIPLKAEPVEGGLVVHFKNAEGLKTSDGGSVSGFQIVDASGTAQWAEAHIRGRTVFVGVPDGVTASAVRFAWDDYPVCNLVNGADLPAGPFTLPL